MNEPTALRIVSGALHVLAAVLFVAAGGVNDAGLLVPAVGSGLGGLLLWGRAARKSVDAQPAAPATRAVRSAVPAPSAEDERLRRLEDLLLSMQSDLAQLNEDRDFFQRLYSGQRSELERTPR